MNKDIVHEISNYLYQIISNAEHISGSVGLSEYGYKIKKAAYSIDALITDVTVKKVDIDISQNSEKVIDLEQFVGLNVLIVDDIIENINIMKNIFSTLSCNIASAQSGEEALKIYEEGFSPDIVCMDMVMPGIDGSTTTRKLKERGCSAYFIAISALKNQTTRVVSLFDCWLPKPFTLEHINGALSGYEASKSNEVLFKSFVLSEDISKEIKEELLKLAENGAYSELQRVVQSLPESVSKDFLTDSIKKIDFQSIIKSIVPS